MEIIQQLQDEILRMSISNLITILLLFYIPFYFSKRAYETFFRLLYFCVGIYLIFTTTDPRIIYDIKLLVGVGLILPQLAFIVEFIKDTIDTIKRMSVNTYYFFITVYYKILRAINFIKSIFENIRILFSNSRKKEQYQEETKQDNYYQGSSFKNDSSNSSYEEQSYQNSYSNDNYSYEKKQDSYSNSSYSSASKEEKKYDGLDRFDSPSAYIVIGVSVDDDFRTIKKAYRKLVRQYHPDLNPDNMQYVEITQKINSAYEKLEKIHNV